MISQRWCALVALVVGLSLPLMAAQGDVVTISSSTGPTAYEEGQQPGQFNLSRGSSSIDPLVVSLKIIPGSIRTATMSNDYTLQLLNSAGVWTDLSPVPTIGVNFTIMIPDGSASTMIRVKPVDDSYREGAESVDVQIVSSANYTVGTANSALVTIADNDRILSVAATDSIASERSASFPRVDVGTFTVSLVDGLGTDGLGTSDDPPPISGGSGPPASASFDLLLGGLGSTGVAATQGIDYAVGFDTGTAWTSYNDVSKVLSGVDSTRLIKGATYWLQDDQDGSGNPIFITVSDIVAGVVTISAAPSGAAWSSSTKYMYVIIPASDIKSGINSNSSVTVTIIPAQDLLTEGAESVVLSVRSSPNYKLSSPTTAEITIADDEILASISPIANAGLPSQSGSVVVELRSSGGTLVPAPRDLTIPYSLSGTAQAPVVGVAGDYSATDYDVPAGIGQLSMPAGQSTAIITIVPTSTAVITGNSETVQVSLLDSQSYQLQSTGASSTNPSATISIANTQGSVSVGSVVDTYESASLPKVGSVVFSIVRTPPPTTPANVAIAFTLSGSASPSDYTVSAPSGIALSFNAVTRVGLLTIPSSATTATLQITATDDQLAEGIETVQIALQAGQRYTLSSNIPITSSVTIADDEPVLSVNKMSDTIEGGSPGVFRVSYPIGPDGNPLQRSITVTAQTSGTATFTTDYTIPTIIIPAGSTFVDVPVTAVLDDPIDDAETVILTLGQDPSFGYTLAAPLSATMTITDGSPTLNIAAASNPAETTGADGTLGTPGVFLITASRAPNRDITVTYSVAGTATSNSTWIPPAHYVSLTGSTVLSAGTTTKSILVNPFNDSLPNPGDTIKLTMLSGTTFLLGSSSSAQVTIADNDTDPNVALPTRVSATNADGTYVAGQTLNLVLTYSQAVVVTGTPYLVLNCGQVDRRANYIGGDTTYANGSTGGTSLNFRYVVDSGDYTGDLDLVSANALILSSGAQINDSRDNYASLTLPAPGTLNSLSGQKNLVLRGAVPGTLAPGKPSTAFKDQGDNGGSCGSGGVGAILATMALWLINRRRR